MKNTPSSKVALVLSGGGAKGAFQFGAIQYLEEQYKPAHPGFDYSIIAGISVGCLNGGMLAMNKYPALKNLWNTMEDDKVYSGSLKKIFPILWRLLSGKKSALSNAPLGNIVQSLFSLKDFQPDYDFRFGFVSLESGLFNPVRPADFPDDDNLRNAVLAATSMPIVWEPVNTIRAKQVAYTSAVDGGIRNDSPLGDVIDGNPDYIIIVNCNPLKIASDATAAESIFSIANRSLTDITIAQIFDSDIEDFLIMNDLVTQADQQGIQLLRRDVDTIKHKKAHRNGKPYKAYKYVLIQPEKDLGDMLDFSQPAVQSRIAEGIRIAKQQLQNFEYK